MIIWNKTLFRIILEGLFWDNLTVLIITVLIFKNKKKMKGVIIYLSWVLHGFVTVCTVTVSSTCVTVSLTILVGLVTVS